MFLLDVLVYVDNVSLLKLLDWSHWWW